MKALITGAGGFAGSHLAEYLLDQGREVVGLVSPRDALTNLRPILPRLQIVRGDVRDQERMIEVLRETRPRCIYHLASLSSAVAFVDQPQMFYDVILTGTMNLLCAWRNLGFESRFLYVSSAEVYGAEATDVMPRREPDPFRPATPYAAMKAAAEMIARQFFVSYGMPVVRARPFQHTGPRQSPSFVCSGLARQIAEANMGLGSGKVFVGNVHVRRDFTDVRDIVRGYYLLLEKGEPSEVYQLCSGRATGIEEILQILLRLTAVPVEVVIESAKFRPHELPASWGDPQKARSLGWEPQIPLETTLLDLKLYWEQILSAEAGDRQGIESGFPKTWNCGQPGSA